MLTVRVPHLALLSQRWGQLDDPNRELPFFSRTKLYSETAVTDKIERVLSDLSSSRHELQNEVRKRLRPDGLPHAPTALYHRPLVRLDDDRFAVPLPWAFQTQLRTGSWARLLGAARKLHGSSGAQIWLSTFGDLVEGWCRFVATEANKGRVRGKLLLSPQIGDEEELEDVLVVEKKTAILFSVKARLMRESVARHASSRTALLDWYDEFFFSPANDGYREGVVPQLSATIDRIRASGKLPPDVRMVPILVTYDALCEDVFLYRRIDERAKKGGWLQQHGVASLVIARVSEFEVLMRHASDGLYLASFLRKREGAWRHRRFDQMIHHELSTEEPLRLDAVVAKYTELWHGIFGRLFPLSREPFPRSSGVDAVLPLLFGRFRLHVRPVWR